MPYKVRKYKTLVYSPTTYDFSVEDYKINDFSTPLRLPGTFLVNYMQPIAENLQWQLENFSYYLPPTNPVSGQLWFNPQDNKLRVYNVDTWVDLTGNVYSTIDSHIADLNNPHQDTKFSIGLGLVDNVRVFDRALLLSDGVDFNAIRTNLNVYRKSNTYTKTETDLKYLPIANTSVDSDKLDGYDSSELMLIASPIANRYILVDSTNTVFSHQSSGFRKITNGSELYTGETINGKLSVNNSSSIRVLLTSGNTSPEISFKFHTKGTLGSDPVQSGIIKLDTLGLRINGNLIFHQGNKPTPAIVGALPVNGTAMDTSLLSGLTNSTTAISSTIVERNSSQRIETGALYTNRTTETTVNPASSIVILPPATNELAFANKSMVFATSGNSITKSAISSGWISFGPSGNVFGRGGYNLTVSKLGTGRYRIFTGAALPTDNYTVNISSVDNQVVSGDARQSTNIVQACVAARTTTYFDIQSKIGINSIYTQVDPDDGRLFGTDDGNRVGVYHYGYEAYYDVSRYAISIYI